MFLVGPPGPLRRHLALAFCELMGKEVEYVSLSRDTTETDLKQRREIVGGTVHYVDQVQCLLLGLVPKQINKQTNKQKHQHIFLTMHKTTASCILNTNSLLAMLSPIVVNSFLDLCPPLFFGGTKNAILLSM